MIPYAISARVDYACRALCALAASEGANPTADAIAREYRLPVPYLRNILRDLRRAGIVSKRHGSEHGYQLSRPAEAVTLGEIFRALEGPLGEAEQDRQAHDPYAGAAAHLGDVWLAVRASLAGVLDQITLLHMLSGTLPESCSSPSGGAALSVGAPR